MKWTKFAVALPPEGEAIVTASWNVGVPAGFWSHDTGRVEAGMFHFEDYHIDPCPAMEFDFWCLITDPTPQEVAR